LFNSIGKKNLPTAKIYSMIKVLSIFLLIFFVVFQCQAQATAHEDPPFHRQSFGIQGGLVLLGNPFVLYPAVNLSYSKTILGKKQHQLAVLPQIGVILLPTIETKFLFSASMQYKYVGRKRFEANVFLGLNYQLRQLAYDRYAFEDNTLVNKGSMLHQVGPTIGLNIGYKIIKKNHFSISPFIGISLTQLNKNYEPNLFAGYKPSATFGITFNK
jgi:hypothetical protein